MKLMFSIAVLMLIWAGAGATTPTGNFGGITDALPQQLGTLKATTDLKRFTHDDLSQLVGDNMPVFDDYKVSSAVSREYGSLRADVFEAKDQFGAFGLFTFGLGPGNEKNVAREEIGRSGARVGDKVIFWKANYFVRVVSTGERPSRAAKAQLALARAIDASMTPLSNLLKKPALLQSLPAQGLMSGSERYFSGPEALAAYVAHARQMYPFFGDAEAALALYEQGADKQPLELLIVEYHTPQFCTDAMAQLTGVVNSLSPDEQNGMIVKRTGNYIVEASNVVDHERAQGLVDSVEYPYTVKWLRNPLWPTDDPFRAQKAAQLLLSTFGFLGLILLTVAIGGAAFGTTIFLRRRKQQRQAFSDAGGMLRLDIDPLEAIMLGLPPKRDEG